MSRNGRKAELDKVEEESTELERFSVGLPPDLAAEVRDAAKRHHTSVQTVLRQYVRVGKIVDRADNGMVVEEDGEEKRYIPLWG